MIIFEKDKSLKEMNTFGVPVTTSFFVTAKTIDDVREIIQSPLFSLHEHIILGGGSNVLFTKNFEGIVIKNSLLGKEIVSEDEKTVIVKIASGENWHEAVMWATENGWGGIENLALVPGSVGATPVQNIGAYGVEIKETLKSVGVIDLKTGETKELDASECDFDYRDSIFKKSAKGKYFITHVVFVLSKIPLLKVEYGAIGEQMKSMGNETPSLIGVRDAVIAIRQAKLPDPKVIGNAGSFFKNPVVDRDFFENLREIYPDMPNFETDLGIKIPAGWLIEQCGWKGRRVGNVGVHEKQALVLVNYGGGTGSDVLDLAREVQSTVHEKFGIHLETEVTII